MIQDLTSMSTNLPSTGMDIMAEEVRIGNTKPLFRPAAATAYLYRQAAARG